MHAFASARNAEEALRIIEANEPWVKRLASCAATYKDRRALRWMQSTRPSDGDCNRAALLGALRSGSRRMLRQVLAHYEDRRFVLQRQWPAEWGLPAAAAASGRAVALRTLACIICAQPYAEAARLSRTQAINKLVWCACEMGSLRMLALAAAQGSPAELEQALTPVLRKTATWASTRLSESSTDSVRDAAALIEFLLLRSAVRVQGPRLPLQPVAVRSSARVVLGMCISRRLS